MEGELKRGMPTPWENSSLSYSFRFPSVLILTHL